MKRTERFKAKLTLFTYYSFFFLTVIVTLFIYHIYPTLYSILPQTKLEPTTVTAKSS